MLVNPKFMYINISMENLAIFRFLRSFMGSDSVDFNLTRGHYSVFLLNQKLDLMKIRRMADLLWGTVCLLSLVEVLLDRSRLLSDILLAWPFAVKKMVEKPSLGGDHPPPPPPIRASNSWDIRANVWNLFVVNYWYLLYDPYGPAIDKIPVWGPYAILAGPDGFFRTCSRHHVRPSYGDFISFSLSQ